MRIVLTVAALSVLASPAFAQEIKGTQMPAPAPIVFFDIAGKQSNTLSEFYSRIFGWQISRRPVHRAGQIAALGSAT
jgi:hypothetical protein